MKYFILEGKDQKGPFDIEELRTKNVTPKTQVWKEGMENWSAAEAIPELSVLFTTPPPIVMPPTPSKAVRKNKSLYIFGSVVIVLAITAIAIYAINQHNDVVGLQQQQNVTQQNNQQQQEQDQAKLQLQRQQLQQQQRQAQIQYLNDHFNQLLPVSVDYNKKTFGGFNNVFVTVQNNSDYDFLNVVVDVKYFTARGAICHEDKVIFADLAPHSKLTESGDNSSEGSMLRFNILGDQLHCASLGF